LKTFQNLLTNFQNIFPAALILFLAAKFLRPSPWQKLADAHVCANIGALCLSKCKMQLRTHSLSRKKSGYGWLPQGAFF